MKKFSINVTRTCYDTQEIIVEAANEKDAEALALNEAGSREFGSGNTEYEITETKELE